MNYQLRTGNLITCSLSSGNHLSRTMTAPPAPYFKFPIRRLWLIRSFQVGTSRCGAGFDDAQDICFG